MAVVPPLRALGLCLGAFALGACGGQDAPRHPADDATGGGPTGAGASSGAGGSGAAGGGGGSAPACDRASATRTASVGAFDALRSELASATSPSAAVDAFVQLVVSSGGTPLVDEGSDRVVFVWRGAPAGPIGVAGSFDDWDAAALPMAKLGDSDLYFADTTIPLGERHEYKIVDGETWREDRLARHVAWDGFDNQGVGAFNAVLRPEHGDPSAGRLEAWRGVSSVATADSRDVFVYVPAVYDDAACPRLPVLELHDGNESLTRAPFSAAADATYAETPDAAALLVFVALPSQDVRFEQYTFGPDSKGDAYVSFLADELLPLEQARLRTCDAPADRGVAGASLGGLISAWAALERPDRWGYVGSQSGSYFWLDGALVQRVWDDPHVAVRFYVDHGCPDDNCESNRDLVEALEAKGYELEHVEEAGGEHDWAFWQKRLPGLLRFFREGKPSCGP